MAYHFSGNVSTPQQRRSSAPTRSTRTPDAGMFTPSRFLQTPRSGKKPNSRTAGIPKARQSPYMTPSKVRITIAPGKTTPMKVFTPTQIIDQLGRKKAITASLPMTPNTPGQARLPGSRKPSLFPPNLGACKLPRPRPSKLVPPTMQGTPRREPRPRTRPTVQLVRVMEECWSDDSLKASQWALTDALSGGRSEERDKSQLWRKLDSAVGQVWPGLREWIMRSKPSSNGDETWFKIVERIEPDELLVSTASSLDRVGFTMTPNTYEAACKIVQDIARRDSDLWYLVTGDINPFFVIYACADCDVPLPSNFDRQLLWRHLDAIIRAKCWRGLGSGRADMQQVTGPDVPSMIFSEGEQDPEGILQSLLNLPISRWRGSSFDSATPKPVPAVAEVPKPVHKLRITIKGYKWVARAQVGTVWYEAGDLYYDDDIACFAVIDALTRLLPSSRDCVVEISTGHLPLLWGLRGSRLGAWSVVQAVCEKYNVKLRGVTEWPVSGESNPWTPINPETITVPPRDGEVVKSVVKFMQELLDSKDAHRCMMEHLRPVNEREFNFQSPV